MTQPAFVLCSSDEDCTGRSGHLHLVVSATGKEMCGTMKHMTENTITKTLTNATRTVAKMPIMAPLYFIGKARKAANAATKIASGTRQTTK